MLHGHPPNGRDDRPLVEPVRVNDVERPPMDRTEDFKLLDGTAGAVEWRARCDVTNTEQCWTD